MLGFDRDDDASMEEVAEAIQTLVVQAKVGVSVIAEVMNLMAGQDGEEMRKAAATLAWKQYQAYMQVGFGPEQALALTSSFTSQFNKFGNGKE